MLKKRRIHAEDMCASRSAPFPVLLLSRELGFRHLQHAAATAATAEPVQQQLVENTLHLIRPQRSFDTHDESASSQFHLGYMQQRSAVQELALQGGLLFVLLQSGLCPVYDATDGSLMRVGYLNSGPHEVIRSLVINKHDNSMLTVSCLTTDTSVLLHCSSTPAEPRSFPAGGSAGFCTGSKPIMEVVGGWGFIEFDDMCSRALLLNTNSMQYKVYDMAAYYSLLFTLPAANVAELKLGLQYLLLVVTTPTQQPMSASITTVATTADKGEQPMDCSSVRASTHTTSNSDLAACPVVHLLVYAAANGQKLSHHVFKLHTKYAGSKSPFDVLELFDDKLLLKLPWHRFEVLTMNLVGHNTQEYLSQVSTFIHLPAQGVFLTVCNHTLTAWNFKAEMVTEFEDHELWYPGSHNSNTSYITDRWVISLCRAKSSATRLPDATESGAIHVNKLADGRQVLALGPSAYGHDDTACDGERPCPSASSVNMRTALIDVTAMLFVEEMGHIYTGDHHGRVVVWEPGQPE